MGFRVSWHIPHRVYRMQVWGDISLEELKAGSDAAIEFLQIGTAPVHCIGDARYIRKAPYSIEGILKATQVLKEPNLGYFLFLSNSQSLNLIGSFVSELSNVNFKSFMKPDDAIAFLQQQDDTLPIMKPYTFSDPSLVMEKTE